LGGLRKVKASKLGECSLLLEVGTPLQIDIEGFRSRFKSSLVGVLPDEYLIVRAPQLALYIGEPKQLLAESEVVVRCLHRGNVWGFKSKLKRVISTPAQLLVLEYPQTVENHNLRVHRRIECLLPGNIQYGETKRKGVVLDISEKGCRFSVNTVKSKKPLEIEIKAALTLSCQLPGIEGEKVFEGRVRRVEKDEMRTELGVEFEAIDPKVRDLIAQYLSVVSDEVF
jgi:c-di-GMP-binding flagellar brake protein YcgR